MAPRLPSVLLLLLGLALVALALPDVPIRAAGIDVTGDPNAANDGGDGSGGDGGGDGEGEPQASLQGPAQLRLGFMLPFPFGDSAVPPRVADEWLSAAKMALTLLGPSYGRFFHVEYYITNSNCSRDSANMAAESLIADGVHAVVGPACSESVVGADAALRTNGVPYISFAATADIFSTGRYNTFFRTVFPDRFQAKAIAAVVSQFRLTNLYLLYTEEVYGLGLKDAIPAALELQGVSVPVVPIAVPYPPPSTPEGYAALFNPGGLPIDCTNMSTAVILATPPNVAQGLLSAANALGKMQYPWWYLGTDGLVTFDLVGQGESMASLASAVQGEIGVGPYTGVDDVGQAEPAFQQFAQFWAQQSYMDYPGLLSLPSEPRLLRPRAYTVNLIDAVWAFHEAARIIVQGGFTLSRATMLSCLRGQGPCATSQVGFQGASGWVAFNGSSGDRLTNPEGVTAPTMYQVSNLVGLTWQYKGTWQSGQVTGLSGANVLQVTRPGPIPEGTPVLPNVSAAASFTAPDDLLAYGQAKGIDFSTSPSDDASSSYSTPTTVYTNNISTGTLIALILLSTLLAFTAIGAIIAWQRSRKNRDPSSYGRMI